MRKTSVVGVVVALLCLAVSAYAFDIGSKVKDAAVGAAKGASKAVVAKEINKDLESKNCAFKPKSTELTCNLADVLSTFKTKKAIAEESNFANDVDIYVEIGRGKDPKNLNLGTERADLIRNKLRYQIGWGDWYDNMTEGDKLHIYVKIE